jgi:hypothetical protein
MAKGDWWKLEVNLLKDVEGKVEECRGSRKTEGCLWRKEEKQGRKTGE